MYICCTEHLELALDHFVDEYEDAPDVYQLAEVTFTEWTAPEHCQFCMKEAEYILV